MLKAVNALGEGVAGLLKEMGRMFMLLLDTMRWGFSLPFRFDLLFQQMERIGVKSVLVVKYVLSVILILVFVKLQNLVLKKQYFLNIIEKVWKLRKISNLSVLKTSMKR